MLEVTTATEWDQDTLRISIQPGVVTQFSLERCDDIFTNVSGSEDTRYFVFTWENEKQEAYSFMRINMSMTSCITINSKEDIRFETLEGEDERVFRLRPRDDKSKDIAMTTDNIPTTNPLHALVRVNGSLFVHFGLLIQLTLWN